MRGLNTLHNIDRSESALTSSARNKLFDVLLIILLIFLAVYFSLPFGLEHISSEKYDLSIVSGFVINGAVWFLLLLCEVCRRAYSLELIHWTFCLFFFSFAPITQYTLKTFPWIHTLSEDTLFRTNIVLLLWTVCFLCGLHSRTLRHIFMTRIKKIFIRPNAMKHLRKRMKFFTAVNILIAAYRLSTYGFMNIFVRGIALVEVEESSINMLAGHCLTAYSAVAAIACAEIMRKNRKYRKFFIINALCLLITNFPTTLSRYAMASVYGGLMLTIFHAFKRSRKFMILFIFAVVIVFPFANVFRHEAVVDVDIQAAFSRTVSSLSNVWNAGDYDAFTMAAMSLEYVNKSGTTLGRQLAGVLLFWMPRSLWPSKPVGSGHFMAMDRGVQFTNISAPPVAEGTINFGLIGVVIFGLIFGAIAGCIDAFYWKDRDFLLERQTLSVRKTDAFQEAYEYFEIIYHIIMFMFFFMSRGDLMSTFAYTIAFIAVWFMMG